MPKPTTDNRARIHRLSTSTPPHMRYPVTKSTRLSLRGFATVNRLLSNGILYLPIPYLCTEIVNNSLPPVFFLYSGYSKVVSVASWSRIRYVRAAFRWVQEPSSRDQCNRETEESFQQRFSLTSAGSRQYEWSDHSELQCAVGQQGQDESAAEHLYHATSPLNRLGIV